MRITLFIKIEDETQLCSLQVYLILAYLIYSLPGSKDFTSLWGSS